MAVVVDVSVAVAWFLPSEESQPTDSVLDYLATVRGIVPGLFWHEMCSIMTQKERCGHIDRDDCRKCLFKLQCLVLERDDKQDPQAVMDLAQKYQLSAYDAVYLETAMRRRASLATVDRKLASAAFDESVEVVPPMERPA